MELPLTIVMWIIFGQSKTLLGSSKSHRKVAAAKLSGFSNISFSIFLFYTHPCHMILSKQKCCLLLNIVSTESQKRITVRWIRRHFSPTRNMTRIHVRLALTYVKILLSSWNIYICVIWWHCIATSSGYSYGH